MEIGFDVKQKGSYPRSCSLGKENAADQAIQGHDPNKDQTMPVPHTHTYSDQHALEAPHTLNRRLPVEEKPGTLGLDDSSSTAMYPLQLISHSFRFRGGNQYFSCMMQQGKPFPELRL